MEHQVSRMISVVDMPWERNRAPTVDQFRTAFGRLPAGVVIVTSAFKDGELAGATVSSLSSLSCDPPMICLGFARAARTLAAIRENGFFSLHLVTEAEQELALRFASKDGDKFASAAYSLSPEGVPQLEGFSTRIDCRLRSDNDAGDHVLLTADIIELILNPDHANPVAWFQRGFRPLGPNTP